MIMIPPLIQNYICQFSTYNALSEQMFKEIEKWFIKEGINNDNSYDELLKFCDNGCNNPSDFIEFVENEDNEDYLRKYGNIYE